jgi:hypothetical protein
MKTKLLITLAGLALVGSAHAGVTLNALFQDVKDSSGNPVATGTLFILVTDTNLNSSFAGGIGLGQSIASTSAADASFAQNQVLTLGSLLSGDTIFAIGGINNVYGSGTYSDLIGLTIGTNGVVASQNTAMYYFPGVTYDSVTAANNKVGTQVGGVNAAAQTGDFTQTMVMGSEGNTVDYGFATVSAGGTTPNFQAVNLTAVPEPSAALLGAIGVLGLLRRRRI